MTSPHDTLHAGPVPPTADPVGFTPGPWKTDPEIGDESVLGPDGVMVADCAIFVNPKFGKRTSKINRANARLIAAGPDMLAALRALTANEPWQNTPHDLLKIARAAIARATGGEP